MHARIHKIGTSHRRAQPLARRAGAIARPAARFGAMVAVVRIAVGAAGAEAARTVGSRRSVGSRRGGVVFGSRAAHQPQDRPACRIDGRHGRPHGGSPVEPALRSGGSPFRAEELAGGFQLLTRPPFGPWLRRLLHTPVETRLSAPALETLAVVAYRQPVLRADIEAIRGVQCGDILRQLMDRDLVRITSRADDLGRPLLYGTTKRFLQIFGLRHLDELPQAAALRRREAPAESSQNPDLPAAKGVESPPTPLQTSENREI